MPRGAAAVPLATRRGTAALQYGSQCAMRMALPPVHRLMMTNKTTGHIWTWLHLWLHCVRFLQGYDRLLRCMGGNLVEFLQNLNVYHLHL
jgi:hypothetical protein